MNRGFGNYFKTGVSTAAGTILNGGKIFKYYVYYFASLIGSAIPFLNALFPVADVRRAKILKEERQMPVVRAFGGIDSGNAFGTTLLAIFLKYLVIIGGVIAIGAIGVMLFAFGAVIAEAAGMWEPLILPVIFCIPAVLAAIAYVIVMLIIYAPVAYIVDSNKNLRATEVLTAASETMRLCGKWTCFLNVFIPALIKCFYIGLATAGFILLTLIDVYEVQICVCTVYAIIAIGGYVVFAPVFTLASTIANNCLFKDICVDPASMNNRTKGVLIKRCSYKESLANKGRDGNLEALFEDVPEPQPAAPDTKYVPPTDAAEKLSVYREEAVQPVPGQPKPQYEPIPEVKFEPVPEVQPEPVPEPAPEPVQEVKPEPVPEVKFEPLPEPVPEPQPEPAQEIKPEPTPEPQPEPTPEPTPEPAPEPVQKFEPLPEDDLWSDLDESWSEPEEQPGGQPQSPKEGNE